MTSYSDLKDQIAELKKQAEAARATELYQAKAQITVIMKEYGLTLADLREIAKDKVAKLRATVSTKYRAPSSGAEWTGRGRAPLWLAGKDKKQFLIK